MKLTNKVLREMIRDEIKSTMAENFSYRAKYDLIMSALGALEEAQRMERHSALGSDPDLDEIVNAVSGYADAVQAMIGME